MLKRIGFSLCAVLTLTACHPRVAPPSAMDTKLSCAQLQTEIKNVEETKQQIARSRGFSGRNVGLALIFWPGVIVNEITGSDAERDANAKLASLQNIYATQCTLEEENKAAS